MSNRIKLAMTFEFDIKNVRKALVLLGQDVPSDEEIVKRFCERETVVVNAEEALSEDSIQMCMAMTAFILGSEEEEKSKP